MTTLLSTPFLFIKTLLRTLWLSVSSIKFYEDVYTSYTGWGAKYLMTISMISSLICTGLLLSHIDKIRNYLNGDVTSSDIVAIEYIITQLPAFEYDGSTISVNEETPSFLLSRTNYKILAIDTKNKLKPAEQAKIPFVLNSRVMTINLHDSNGERKNHIPIKYEQLFGNTPQVLTQEIIKSSFGKLFKKAPALFTYILFPILSMLIFLSTGFEKILLIATIVIVTNLSSSKTPIRTCVRLVFFASGIHTLLQFIMVILEIDIGTPLWTIQTWSNLLMILGVLKARGIIKLHTK